MGINGPRELGSMSVDVDDDAPSCHHPYHRDSGNRNSAGPSGERTPSNPHPWRHQTIRSVQTSTHSVPSHQPGREHLSGSDDSLQFMTPPSLSSPVNCPGEMRDTRQRHSLVRQLRGILLGSEPSEREITPRKRRRTHDSPHTPVTGHDYMQDDGAFTDGANPQSSRRTRPRLRIQQDREFSPLFIVSPSQERDPLVEEETISALYYPLNVADPSHSGSIQRYFYLRNPQEHEPRTLQTSPSLEDNDLEDGEERHDRRSDSANSFAQVALASTSTVTVAPKHGRLSTLQDFRLPRPFEETGEQPSAVGIVKVHERGLDTGPVFFGAAHTSNGRMGGRVVSGEPAGLPPDPLGHPIREDGVHTVPPEPSSTIYFDKPICDSPDPIDPTGGDGTR